MEVLMRVIGLHEQSGSGRRRGCEHIAVYFHRKLQEDLLNRLHVLFFLFFG
jgi:hypothetical protein